MKKRYEKPLLEVYKMMTQHLLLENSGETDDPMGKETSFLWDDVIDDNNLWGDESEEE